MRQRSLDDVIGDISSNVSQGKKAVSNLEADEDFKIDSSDVEDSLTNIDSLLDEARSIVDNIKNLLE
jgi:hypothetical protein